MFQISLLTTAVFCEPTEQPSGQIEEKSPYLKDTSYARLEQTNEAPILSYVLEIPNIENPSIPFQLLEISDNLEPPAYNFKESPVYYEQSIPNTDLRPPVEEPWNVHNDPKLYYNYQKPNVEDTPTDLYPKKFHREFHELPKQYVSKYLRNLKDERVLEEEDNSDVQEKKFIKFEKLLNKNRLNKEKVPKNLFNSDRNNSDSSKREANKNNSKQEFDYGLEPIILSSLGIHASPSEQLEFRMHGHDGPESYKWGFDTGKR